MSKRLLLLVIIFVSLLSSTYSRKNPELANFGNRVWLSATTPIHQFMHYFKNSGDSFLQQYVFLLDLKEKNQKLEDRLKNLQTDNTQLKEIEMENARLNTLLKFKRRKKLTSKIANVIAFNTRTSRSLMLIDYGKKQGAKPGQVVIYGNQLLGQIINSSRVSSQVMLINDPLSNVDCLIQESRTRGVASGNLIKGLQWNFVGQQQEFKIGDKVISSGLDGVFPKGLNIGIISHKKKNKNSLFQKVQIAPGVDFFKIETVMIIAGIKQ